MVVVRRVLGEHAAEVSFPEDQHPIGDFGADGQDEAFGEAVRLRAAGWDLDHLNACIGQHRVERRGELSGSIADQEPELGGVVAYVPTLSGPVEPAHPRSRGRDRQTDAGALTG